MAEQLLSSTARSMLRSLIRDERDSIRSGHTRYDGTYGRLNALADLDELDRHLDTIVSASAVVKEPAL